MDSLQPLVRKVDHIEGFRFHPEDTQNQIFDVIVNGMQIFEGMHENGEKCEYMYIHSKDGNVYKALLPANDFMNINAQEEDSKDNLSISYAISKLKQRLYEYTDMIPTKIVNNIDIEFSKKHNNKGFFLAHTFKCKKNRMSFIIDYISILQNFYDIYFNKNIIKEIDAFNQYYDKRCRSRSSRRTPKFEGYDDSLPGVTKEDIEHGNEILRKMIAYLEEKQAGENK